MVTFNPSFLREFILLAYSSGCKIFPGSETKSLAKKVPSSKALNFSWLKGDGLFLTPVISIVIILLSFCVLYFLNSYDLSFNP